MTTQTEQNKAFHPILHPAGTFRYQPCTILLTGSIRELLLKKTSEPLNVTERGVKNVGQIPIECLDIARQFFLAFGYRIGPDKAIVKSIVHFQQPSSKRTQCGGCLHNSTP